MVYEELERRLNDGGYMNWVKAGQCLSLLRDGLLPFTTQHARAFHGDLLNHNTQLKKPCQTSACKPEGNKVIRFRNELMHSCKLHVGDDWMRHFSTSLTKLLQQLGGVPQIATAGKHIKEMLSVDLSIYVSGLDRMDSAALDGLESDSVLHWEISPVLIGQWEVQLLQESLQESLHAADDDAKPKDPEQLKRLGGFLQANRDLGLRFSAELQAINSLHASE
ncbi:uncharacterized protein CXorf38 homolog [Pungitius pungitius]|uniref:uncharacterized protein CXorf38 homolog n=1 Tax=Pungitius pungitius TaxID=134920 RepID=UPI002E0EB0B8